MAEDAPSQLPLPSPGSPAEQRKRSKSRSELQETSEETYEFRKTAAGQYEKKTTKSERHERKTSDEETFVATGLPSPSVSLTGWHEQVPERVKLEVSGVTAEGCRDAPSLDADYILDLLDRRPERCRWEYTFRAKCQLFRCCLEAYPDSDGTLTLWALFEGSVAGPAWTQTGLRDLSGTTRLNFDYQSAENPSVGCRWPETVTLTAIATPAATKRFYISPEPTLGEMAAMASASSSSSSGGRRKIIMIGYWPPTGIQGMLNPWKTEQKNYKKSGFDVQAYGAEFPDPPILNPAGTGKFRVDYQATSTDFWTMVASDRPIAIMGFGVDGPGPTKKWSLETAPKNLKNIGHLDDWRNDYNAPKLPAVGEDGDGVPPNTDHEAQDDNPPDATQAAGLTRSNTLPYQAIKTAVQTAVPAITVRENGNAGDFLCNYLAYHLGWYQEWSETQEFPTCEMAGFVHVADDVTATEAAKAVTAQLDAVIAALNE